MNQQYGATIERGFIIEVCEDGYKVKSYTRDGITTPALSAASGTAYEAGDRVYFFMFDDGNGAILAKF